MELAIEYCGVCNYRPIAANLARAIESATGIKAALIHSRDMGALEVKVDGELIFSKKKSDRFPDPAGIIALIREKQ